MMTVCPVSHLPFLEKPQWKAPHPDESYTTVFKGIGPNIIHLEMQTDKDSITLEHIDKHIYQKVIREMSLTDKKIYTVANFEHVSKISLQYKKDFSNIVFNWGPQYRLLVLYNVGQEIETVIDTFIAMTPDTLPMIRTDNYEEAMKTVMADCQGAEAPGQEDPDDDEDDLSVYKNEFLATLARISWFKLFTHPVRLPDETHELYPFLKGLACLQEDLLAKHTLQQQQLHKLKQEYDQKILEKNVLLNAQQTLNNTLKKQLEEEKNALIAEVAGKDMELTRISTAIAEKTTKLNDLCRQLSAMDLERGLKKKIVGSCQEMIATELSSKQFESCLNEIDSRFLSKLQQKHPDLNQRELQLCLLIKNNLSTREIASSIGITPRGVESIRYRLHKKLGLKRHESIKNYIARTAALFR